MRRGKLRTKSGHQIFIFHFLFSTSKAHKAHKFLPRFCMLCISPSIVDFSLFFCSNFTLLFFANNFFFGSMVDYTDAFLFMCIIEYLYIYNHVLNFSTRKNYEQNTYTVKRKIKTNERH